MQKIFIPSDGPEDWKKLLAQPDLHWKTGHSACATAYAWEAAEGLPPTACGKSNFIPRV